MPEFDNKDMIFLAVFWSLLILGVGVGVGHSWSQKDCGTCEAALDKAIDELHTCQEERLTQVGSRCEDERQAERKRCKVTLSQYKKLKCKICEIRHDTFPPVDADHGPKPAPLSQ